jgi:hypothetical protein
MNRRGAVLALVLLGAAPPASLAADDQPVLAPYVEPGDCWSYRADGYFYKGPITDYELCVNFVDTQKDVVLAVATVKSDGREIDTSYSLEWAERTSIDGLIRTPEGKFYKFPLRVGDTYKVQYDYREALRGLIAGTVKWEMKVIGWEDVTVPAGTFHALKIEGRGYTERHESQLTYNSTRTIWYVPQVHRHVKTQIQDRWSRIGEELTGYHLSK